MATREGGRILSETLTELAALSAEPFDVAELVQLATERACQMLASDGAIVLLSLDGVGLHPAGYSGAVGDVDVVMAIEGVPCRQALRTGAAVAFAEERAHEEFPEYAAFAADAGISRVLSVPLCSREGVFGTLSMVRLSATDYDEDEVEAAHRLAAVVAASIVREQALRAALAVTAQLEHALQARVVIEQAKGMVAAELDASIEDALDLIRRFSRARQIRLADVAADIVARELPIGVLRV